MKNGSVILELQRATHATLSALAEELADLDLTPSEINALGNLADGVARTVTELGTASGTRPATVTGVLDRLERRGLITRGARPGDRRVVLIELTKDGIHSAELIRDTLRHLEAKALAGLPGRQIDSTHAVLRALARVRP